MSMPSADGDTIAAIATAPGEAGIAVIRVSGPQAFTIADRIFRSSSGPPSEWPANTFKHGYIGGRKVDVELDEVILLVYRPPRSYTREKVVEIQGHGGRVCAQRILRRVLDCGARPAEPGEFTKRAFLNGRIDLLQAEAVMDLIEAHSDRAAQTALQQLDGVLSSRFTAIYEELLAVAVELEATLNFDEDELPVRITNELRGRLDAVRDDLKRLIATWEEGHLLREGARVVISGRPNVGKSTLLNVLLGSARSIVTHVSGTTRDTIEEEMVVAGVPLRLIDTAGLRVSDCIVEREGIQRAQTSIAAADIILHVVDASQELDAEECERLAGLPASRTIVILNKSDLPARVNGAALPDVTTIRASLIQGDGRDDILKALVQTLGVQPSAPPHATLSERHRRIVQNVLTELNTATNALAADWDDMVTLAASNVRYGLEELGKVTGRTYSNDLLDSIFNRFCIGK